jgi:hypothetical protein
VVVRDRAVDLAATQELRERLEQSRGPVTWTYDRGPLGRE